MEAGLEPGGGRGAIDKPGASCGDTAREGVVDALSGQQDIIIRPLGRSLLAVRGFSGASELADERIALVLDPGALIEEASMSGSRDRGGRFLANG